MNGNQPQKKTLWAAATSFVLSLVNVVSCCFTTYVFAPLSIAFGIVSLVNKWDGKGLSIAGIIISSVSLVMLIILSVFLKRY